MVVVTAQFRNEGNDDDDDERRKTRGTPVRIVVKHYYAELSVGGGGRNYGDGNNRSCGVGGLTSRGKKGGGWGW